jgi:hypothetical protein
MTEHTYNWKRFFCPREGYLDLSDGGYLFDPDTDSTWAKFHNHDLKVFTSILDIPCLIILGERGMGKSRFLEAQQDSIAKQVEVRGGEFLPLNLNICTNDTFLIEELFKSNKFINWTTGSHELHLWLDSFDECQLQIKTLANLLIHKLQPHADKIERLFLRIACRTAEWPNSLEEKLRKLWKDEKQNVEIYELAPLRRKDVTEAATANNLDSEKFLAEIGRTQTAPFAIKPVTLKFLIDIFKKNEQLPQTQAELYFQGCQLLCEETNPDRRDSGLIGKLTVERRMAVVSRIAALTLFSNHPAIWTEADRGNMPDGDLSIDQLYGGQETAEINGFLKEFEVGQDEIKEALGTALFSGRGPSRMGWAHQSYADFLAARYLKDCKIELTQMLALITHPDDAEKHLVPQLYETAAWLGTMDREVFQAIMRTDPDVLLLSDVASADEADRGALVEELLKLLDEGKLRNQYNRQYSKLKHSNIDQQLRPYLQGKSKGMDARNVAIDIAEACKAHSLQQDLADIALDSTEDIEIRVSAARAVNWLGDKSAKMRLKPLTTSNASEDHKGKLRASGVEALWPECINAQELFTLLTPSAEAFDAYHYSLADHVVTSLQIEDLRYGLNWVQNHSEDLFDNPYLYSFGNLADAILHLTWKHLDNPDMLEYFAKIISKQLNRIARTKDLLTRFNKKEVSCPLWMSELFSDATKRLILIEKIILLGISPDKNLYSLIPNIDIMWIVDNLCKSNEEQEKKVWAYFLWQAHKDEPDNPRYCDAIITASESNLIVREYFALPSCSLESGPDQLWTSTHQTRQQEQQEPSHLDLTPSQKIQQYLGEFELGDLDAWPELILEMSLKPDSMHYLHTREPDLMALPGWAASDSKTQKRIIQAAKIYVLNGDPQTDEWLGTNSTYASAIEGYGALLLLLREEPIFISTIPPGIWQKWAPVILEYRIQGNPEAEAFQKELIRRVDMQASDEILSTLEVLIDKDILRKSIYTPVLERLKFCWDGRIAQLLLKKAQTENLGLSYLERLLDVLLEQNDKGAISYAEFLIRFGQSQAIQDNCELGSLQKTVISARLVMVHTPKISWGVIWSAIKENTFLGRKIVESAAQNYKLISQRLEEEQIAALYIWIQHQYPHSQDPQHQGAFNHTTRDNIAFWRGSLLNQLRDRGTVRACEEIQRIVNEFPDLSFLKGILTEAKHKTRQNTWRAPEPQDVLKLTRGQHNRLVQNGEQLIEVLIESLKRLQQKLQGGNTQAFTLWDEQASSKTWQPKDENHFSDYVKDFLDEDLRLHKFIVNREVEFRRGTGHRGGGQPGERLDIKVEVFSPGHDRELTKITAIIEVKGCWNEGLNSAMQDQLLNRYLEESQCRHGLYLIGWYFCPQWDEDHYQKKDALRFTRSFSDLSSAQIHFDEQAAALSQDGKYVRAFVMNTALR